MLLKNGHIFEGIFSNPANLEKNFVFTYICNYYNINEALSISTDKIHQ